MNKIKEKRIYFALGNRFACAGAKKYITRKRLHKKHRVDAVATYPTWLFIRSEQFPMQWSKDIRILRYRSGGRVFSYLTTIFLFGSLDRLWSTFLKNEGDSRQRRNFDNKKEFPRKTALNASRSDSASDALMSRRISTISALIYRCQSHYFRSSIEQRSCSMPFVCSIYIYTHISDRFYTDVRSGAVWSGAFQSNICRIRLYAFRKRKNREIPGKFP